MKYSYYPGCTLKTKAKELDRYARLSAEALGITLNELPEWQCCLYHRSGRNCNKACLGPGNYGG